MNFFKDKNQLGELEEPKAQANKTGINFMIFILLHIENCLQYNALHDFSVWLRTDSNLADINRFRSNTGNLLTRDQFHEQW